MNKRDAAVIAFMAHKGFGKTFLILTFVKMKLKAGNRAIIIDPNGKEPAWNGPEFKRRLKAEELKPDFNGAEVLFYRKGQTFKHILDLILNHGMNGFTLVLDDMNVYGTNMEEELETIIQLSRNWGIDILLTCHSWHRTPPIFFTYIDVFILGPTKGNPNCRKELLGGKEGLAKHWEWKNKADAAGEKAINSGKKKWDHEWFTFDIEGDEVTTL